MSSGSWYDLPNAFFENITYEERDEQREKNSIYSEIFHLKKISYTFTQFLTHVTQEKYNLVDSVEFKFQSNLKKLVVVDCGEGNWNEVYTDSKILIYDLGASVKYTEKEIRTLVSQRFLKYESKVDIVISHWDKDHFQALKYLTDNELKKINAVYGPDNIPSSNVYRDTMKYLIDKKVKYYLIKPTKNRRGNCIDLNLLSDTKDVDLYRAVKGRSRNQTGIVLVIKGKHRNAILTGDHHYQKIFNVINGKYKMRDIILVVPHHGGAAGSLNVSDWKTQFSSIECPISVGENSYKHPYPEIYKKLTRLQRTDQVKDITYLL